MGGYPLPSPALRSEDSLEGLARGLPSAFAFARTAAPRPSTLPGTAAPRISLGVLKVNLRIVGPTIVGPTILLALRSFQQDRRPPESSYPRELKSQAFGRIPISHPSYPYLVSFCRVPCIVASRDTRTSVTMLRQGCVQGPAEYLPAGWAGTAVPVAVALCGAAAAVAVVRGGRAGGGGCARECNGLSGGAARACREGGGVRRGALPASATIRRKRCILSSCALPPSAAPRCFGPSVFGPENDTCAALHSVKQQGWTRGHLLWRCPAVDTWTS